MPELPPGLAEWMTTLEPEPKKNVAIILQTLSELLALARDTNERVRALEGQVPTSGTPDIASTIQPSA